MVYLGFNMTCCQIVKCWKLVKNGSVYAAPKSRHLWLGTRPGGGSVWGGRPMNREWREGILGTFPVPQQVDVGDTHPPNHLHWNCTGWRVTLLQCGGQGGQWKGRDVRREFRDFRFWSVSRENIGTGSVWGAEAISEVDQQIWQEDVISSIFPNPLPLPCHL